MPSETLSRKLAHIAPYEAQIVKNVNTLVKDAASRNKRCLEVDNEQAGPAGPLKKKAKMSSI